MLTAAVRRGYHVIDDLHDILGLVALFYVGHNFSAQSCAILLQAYRSLHGGYTWYEDGSGIVLNRVLTDTVVVVQETWKDGRR